MSTSINSLGVTFPDTTTQTTAATSPIPATTVMLFYQSAAPTGWTQVTSLNDYDLRLVSGAGGTTGGTTAYSTVFANQTPTFTGAIGSLAGGATTLSTTQIPSHTHPVANLLGGNYTGDYDYSSGNKAIQTNDSGSPVGVDHILTQ